MQENHSHTYHFPRLHRERIYGGRKVFFDMTPNESSFRGDGADRMILLSAKRETFTYTANSTNMSMEDDEYGRHLKTDGASGILSLGMEQSKHDGHDTGNFGDFGGGGVTLLLQFSFDEDNNQNQYPISCGGVLTDGWYCRRHATADYYAHGMYSTSGSTFTYSTIPSIVTGTRYHWASVIDMDAGTTRIHRNLVDITQVSAATRPDPATVVLKTAYSSYTKGKLYRFCICEGKLSHAEIAMHYANLM